MSLLNVQGLEKRYDKFHLKDVSFQLDRGYIMGFIGSNGSGKTTTLKSILNMVHPNSGKVMIFDQDFIENEIMLKQKIGYMFGGTDFYSKRKLSTITNVVKRFYPEWDETAYQRYIKRFHLDEDKKIDELSEGMKVHYALAIALAHNAELFIFDEPTSGLDPVARDQLLELFQSLIEDGEKSILFSTHITTDIEKCADYVTYINDGRIIKSASKDDFIGAYKIVKGTKEQLTDAVKQKLIAYKLNSFGFSGMVKTEDAAVGENISIEPANLEEIMIYYAKRGEDNEGFNV